MKRVLAIASLMTFGGLVTACRGSADRGNQVANAIIAAWNSHDVEKVIPVYTEGVLYEDVTFGLVNHGSAELRKFATFFFDAVPDLKLEMVKSTIDGQHGTIEWVFSGADKGVYKTGKKFSVRGVSVIDLEEGKVSRSLDFYDSAAIMRQVGLLPSENPANAK